MTAGGHATTGRRTDTLAPGPTGTSEGPGGPEPAGRPARRTLRLRRSWRRVAIYSGWAALLALIVLYPIGNLFWISLQVPEGGVGLTNFIDGLTDPDLLIPARNSVLLSVGTVIGSTLLGLPLAYVVSRTNIWGRPVVSLFAVLTFASPSYIAALGWLLLIGPRSGLVNRGIEAVFGIEGLFNAFSPWAILFILCTFYFPIVYIPAVGALNNVDPTMEEAAAALGARGFTLWRKITLPLITPALAAGALLVFVYSFTIFGPIMILGGPTGFQTIPTKMFELLSYPPRLETAGVLAVPTLATLAVLVVIQRRLTQGRSFSVIGGKPSGGNVRRLGRWRLPVTFLTFAVLFVTYVLPFGILILTSFQRAIGRVLAPGNWVFGHNYINLYNTPGVVTSFRNSFVLAVLGVTGALLIAFFSAWLNERGKSPINPLITPACLAPIAFSGAIIGLALTIGYGGWPFFLTGTMTIIFVAYVTNALPLSYLYVQAGMKQLGPEVEEASRSLGAGPLTTARRITLPLLKGSVLPVALVNFVYLFRELDASVFLYTGTNSVSGVVLFNLAATSRFGVMGAMSTILLLMNIAIVLFAFYWLMPRSPARKDG